MLPVALEDRLLDLVASTWWSAEKWVDAMYPWGEEGTFLAQWDGPDAWQRRALRVIDEQLASIAAGTHTDNTIRIAVSSGHGVGKLQPNSTATPTPHGWRRFGDLRVGDEVFSASGAPTRIVAIYERQNLPIYQVTFDDGASVLACEDHLWAVRGRNDRRTGRDGYQVLDTKTLMQLGVKRSNGRSEARQWEIPIQGAAQYQQRAPIDPYLMGVWLGDGATKSPRLAIAEPEIAERLRRNGADMTTERVTGGRCPSYYVRGGTLKPYLGQKRIPLAFLQARVEDRMELLRGLMDTDGTIDARGIATFTSTQRELAVGLIELVRSLGGKAKLHPTVRAPWCRDCDGKRIEGAPAYVVTVRCAFAPFHLSRKVARWRPCEARYLTRWIDRIEYVGDMDGRCIKVAAADSLYLTDHFIVTHNTAFMGWIDQWWMATRPNPQVVVTAGTLNQLKTKTWRETKKWLDVCLVGHWFQWNATTLELKGEPTWRANAIPWSAHNAQSFAGTHEKYVLYEFDEASTIANQIWETSEGAFTTEGPHMWLAFGNPEQATGRFRECWGARRKYWVTFEVDARESRLSNKNLIKQWAEQYGEDSDFFRVRVKGEPPKTGPSQLIGTELVERAEKRFREKEIKPEDLPRQIPRVMGVDPAGGDSPHSAETVLVLRKGPYLYPDIVAFREGDGMKCAAMIGHYINLWNPAMVFMDCHGLGKPIYDRLVQLGFGDRVVPCYAGETDTVMDKKVYYNCRIEWWARMRDWLQGGAIPFHARLREDLMAPQRHYNLNFKMQLESKDDMALRGVQSPDYGDALAHTFAHPVPTLAGDELGGSTAVEPDIP